MVPVGFQTIDGRMSPHPTQSPTQSTSPGTSHGPSAPSPFRCVVFSVAGQALALPVEAVRRFLPLPRLDRLPTAPQPVEGVFRYHGEIVPVLRLGVLLDLAEGGGGGESGLYAPLILITWQGRPTALLVDQVHGDVALPAEDRVASDPSLSFNGCAAGAFPDRVTGRAGTVTLLDPDRLLSEAEGRLLDAFRAAEERRLARWDGAA
ncbi:putative Chemotaxis signal transduction protein CheW-like (plasmid) [Azospirillum lipoferum 4B]|uniref:Chemotaxis signal transduction protein CheW-like n=1 Tax=Azospirillum lipoferum (strain 4B) TaxID=862719 RepID=G7ZDH0_AZOL4|nr:putative Chemotaxis signal transduction protein CheW-like [Azospirillum lipoferum 4B]